MATTIDCEYVYVRGVLKGNKCGKINFKDGYCRKHQPVVENGVMLYSHDLNQRKLFNDFKEEVPLTGDGENFVVTVNDELLGVFEKQCAYQYACYKQLFLARDAIEHEIDLTKYVHIPTEQTNWQEYYNILTELFKESEYLCQVYKVNYINTSSFLDKIQNIILDSHKKDMIDYEDD